MADNKTIKDGLGDLFALRMKDISPQGDGSLMRSVFYTTPYPLDYGAGGVYRNVAYSGQIAGSLPAGSVIYAFQWSSISMWAVVNRVRLAAWSGPTAFTALGPAGFELYFARNFTAQDTGGTSIILAGDQNQLRTSMNASQASIVVAGTGALSPGTRTPDTYPLENQIIDVPLTTFTTFNGSPAALFETMLGDHPLVIAPNEGFEIVANVPPIGNWNFSVTLNWSEVQMY